MKSKTHHKKKKKKTRVQTKENGEKNPKAYGPNSAISSKRALARAADLDQKKYHHPLLDRTESASDSAPPYIVVVQGPAGVGKSTLVRCLMRHFTRQNLNSAEGPMTVIAGKNRRLTFVECPHDLNGMIDCAKFADLVLLLIDASFGYELETFEFINLLQIHGFPKVMGVLTHADQFASMTPRNRAKKKLKTRFETEVYKGAKIFCLSGFRNRKYLHHEVKNLARFISVMKIRPLSWRIEHPYLLADRFEDITPESKTKQSPKCDRDILLYGYLRGTNFRPGAKVHISGVGDLEVEEVEMLSDPCPLPKSTLHRSLSDKERLIYAPMSDLDGFIIDKDAVYVDIPDWKLHYSSQERSQGETKGDKMIKELQRVEIDVDKHLEERDGRLFASGPVIEFEKCEKSHMQDEMMEEASTEDEEGSDAEMKNASKKQRKLPNYEVVDEASRNRKRVIFNDDAEDNLETCKWKQNMKERTKENFQSDAHGFASYIYKENFANLAPFDSSFFIHQENLVEEDSSRNLQSKDLMEKWRNSNETENFRNRFSTGDWAEGKLRSEAQPSLASSENSEAGCGDFEDLELGETFTSENPDEITQFAQDAIRQAQRMEKKELRRLEEKKSKKENFDKEYDQGGGAKGINEEKEKEEEGNEFKRDRNLPSFYDAVKSEMSEKLKQTREAMDSLDPKERILLEGFRPGAYLRMKFKGKFGMGCNRKEKSESVTLGVPYEMVECFTKARPILIGGLSPEDMKHGYLRMRIKRHRWFPKILKTKDPLIFSIGWRRFQSIPIFCTEDHNRRIRMLKYTPEHSYCLAVIWGPLCPANTSFGAFQSLDGNLVDWRVSASGTITEIDASIRVVKKLKLIGTPAKIQKTTSFITGMFNSPLEVAKFEGASIRTVSGIRGTIKKAVKDFEGGDPGTFRASFEDRLVSSDLIFLRAWVSVDIPKFSNPVTDLLYLFKQAHKQITRSGEEQSEALASEEEWKLPKWLAMKTVAEIRRVRNLGAPQRVDSQYAPIQRAKRKFSNLKLPTKLVAALPYDLKPKPQNREESRDSLLDVVPEQHEAKVSGLVDQLNFVHQHKIEKRKMQKARQLLKLKMRQNAELKRREHFNKEEKKERSKEAMFKTRRRTSKHKRKQH